LFAAAQLLFDLLARADVEHETNAHLQGLVEHGDPKHHRHAAAVAPDVLLFPRWRDAGGPQLLDRYFVEVPPLRWGQIGPAHPALDEVGAGVAYHFQEGFVGFGDVAVQVRNDNADDIRVHQAPEAFFAAPQIFFDALGLGDVERKADALFLRRIEHGNADDHGNAAAV